MKKGFARAGAIFGICRLYVNAGTKENVFEGNFCRWRELGKGLRQLRDNIASPNCLAREGETW